MAPLGVFVLWVVRGSSTVGTGYAGIGEDLGFLIRPALNSVVAAVVAAACAMVVTLPVAYTAARRRSRVSDAAAAIVTSLFALPGLVVALAIVFWTIRAPGPLAALYQSFPLLVAAYVFHFGAQSMRASSVAIARRAPPVRRRGPDPGSASVSPVLRDRLAARDARRGYRRRTRAAVQSQGVTCHAVACSHRVRDTGHANMERGRGWVLRRSRNHVAPTHPAVGRPHVGIGIAARSGVVRTERQSVGSRYGIGVFSVVLGVGFFGLGRCRRWDRG